MTRSGPASDETVLCERRDGVATITLNRPEVHNALNATVLAELKRLVGELAGEAETRAIVITGAGEKAFSAGADLDELAGLDAVAGRQVLRSGQATMRALETCPKPIIAAVNGWALGGGFELALSCAFIVGSSAARFGLPEVGLGLMPGYGGTQRLPRAVGAQTARRFTLTGQPVDAQRAYELGILSEPPLAPEALLGSALETAAVIAANGPEAVELILTASRAGEEPGGGLAHEAALGGIALGSAQGAEGIAAFQQKRRPDFGGSR